MKKLFVTMTAVGLAVASQAAQVDWRYDATESDVGQTVYVLIGSSPKEQWESKDALASAAVSSGTIAKSGRKDYLAKGTAVSADITKESADLYYVVVSADGNTFGVTSVSSMTDSVYDPDAMESTPGTNTSLSSGSLTKSGIAWGTGGGDDPGTGGGDDPGTGGGDDPGTGGGESGGVPEPTSGILLMIGGAALALRRRR